MAGDFDIGPADYEADMSDNGKGDSPRPMSVDTATFGKRWEETFRTCTGYGIGPCDQMGPNGSCAACGKGLEKPPEPIGYIDRSEDVIRVPIKLRHPLETLGDPEE